MNKYCVVFNDGEIRMYKSESLLQLVDYLCWKYEQVISITKLPDDDNDGVHTI